MASEMQALKYKSNYLFFLGWLVTILFILARSNRHAALCPTGLLEKQMIAKLQAGLAALQKAKIKQ